MPRFLTPAEAVELDRLREHVQAARPARNRYVLALARDGVSLRQIGRGLGVTHRAVRQMIDAAEKDQNRAA